MSETLYDVLKRYEWGASDDAIVKDAIRHFSKDIELDLWRALLDEDDYVRRRGLSIFADIGKMGINLIDAALISADSLDYMARAFLMDGILCYSKRLNPQQASVVLKMAGDAHDLVREKVIAFLASANCNVIDRAIELVDLSSRYLYRNGFSMFDVDPLEAQQIFDKGIVDDGIISTFKLAAIERMASDGRLVAPLVYDGDSYIGMAVLANSNRLAQRAARRRGLANK